jgi:predicted transcriptional regulator
VTSPNPLSRELRELRSKARLSGAEAARRAGITQSKVSRAETGTFLPTEDDVKPMAAAVTGESARALTLRTSGY